MLPSQIYVHLKEGPGPDGLDTLKNKPQLHSLVAKQLCQNLAGRNAIIFTGPSITSLNLFQEFEKQGRCCNVCATVLHLSIPCIFICSTSLSEFRLGSASSFFPITLIFSPSDVPHPLQFLITR